MQGIKNVISASKGKLILFWQTHNLILIFVSFMQAKRVKKLS